MARLSGSDSLGPLLQVKIPELTGLIRSLSDEVLVEMFVKTCVRIKQTDISLPDELMVEDIANGFAWCNGCLRELQSRKKLHLLDGLEEVARRKE